MMEIWARELNWVPEKGSEFIPKWGLICKFKNSKFYRKFYFFDFLTKLLTLRDAPLSIWQKWRQSRF